MLFINVEMFSYTRIHTCGTYHLPAYHFLNLVRGELYFFFIPGTVALHNVTSSSSYLSYLFGGSNRHCYPILQESFEGVLYLDGDIT